MRFVKTGIFIEMAIIFLCTGYFKSENEGRATLISPSHDVKKIALSFDDGPSSEYTKVLIDGLKDKGVVASFFMTGKNIAENREIVREISEGGHLIGNHTYSHVNLTKLPLNEALAEIRKTNELVREITGEEPEYIRPPYGAWNEKLEDNVDMMAVMWDVDPLDWETNDSAKVTVRIVSCAENDYIILLHDIFESSVESALNVVDLLKKDGYEFVTVDEILGVK